MLVAATLLTSAGFISKGPVGNTSVPQPSQSVDLTKYLGRWYEIARYEASFEKIAKALQLITASATTA